MQPFDNPEVMSTAEIKQTIADYAQAAENAMQAGCDGVELHCTSGYLPAQFLSTGTNRRSDEYGGPVENRIRFVVQTLEAIGNQIGFNRLGIRICPGNPFNDLSDEDPKGTFEALLKAINPMKLAYLHVIRMDAGVDNIALANANFDGPIILNDSYTLGSAQKALDDGEADAISFGRPYISNPDLVEKFGDGRDLVKPDFKTLYTPGPAGYTDY